MTLIPHHTIVVVPVFPKLHRFPEGREFHQWTGNDSKALMKVCMVTSTYRPIYHISYEFPKVYLPAIADHIPDDMVKCMAAFLDICYIIWLNAISLDTIDNQLTDPLN